MALRIELGPGEKIYIGRTLVTNGRARASLHLSGREKVLKHKDVIEPEQADTVCKRLYVEITAGYLTDNPVHEDHACLELIKEIAGVAPSLKKMLGEISKCVLIGEHYTALKLCKHLIEQEELLMAGVRVDSLGADSSKH